MAPRVAFEDIAQMEMSKRLSAWPFFRLKKLRPGPLDWQCSCKSVIQNEAESIGKKSNQGSNKQGKEYLFQ